MVFDREMLQLTNLPAAALTLNEINSGGSEQLPQCHAKFAGKYFPNMCAPVYFPSRQPHFHCSTLFQTSNPKAAPFIEREIGQASASTSTEVEGLKDDTHPEGVKEEEVGNTHTRE